MIEGIGNAVQAYSEQDAPKKRRLDITLRQNIDGQIEQAEKRVKELLEAKARLESSGILDTRIDDLTNAMRW